MERVRRALAAIKADKRCAEDVLGRGLREAPEVFIPGLAHFVGCALHGEILVPEMIELPPPK